MSKSSKIDIPLLLIVITLLLLGLLAVYSTSSFQAIKTNKTSLFYLINQLKPLLFGGFLAFIISKINYRVFNKLALPIIAITVFMLIYIILFGKPINNVKRWIIIGGLSIQPGEIAKLSIVIWLSSYFSSNRCEEEESGLKKTLPAFAVSGLVIFLLMMEPSFGVAFSVSISALFLMFIGGVSLKYIASLAGLGSGTFMLALSRVSYAKARFSSFLSGEVHQAIQSMQGIGAGGIFGVGLGQGKEKLLFLPYPHTDFIFSSFTEELGLLGSILLFALFTLLFQRGIKIASHARERFGSLLAVGITLNIFISALLHIGVASGVLPTTGLPLPFISYGGSSLVVNLISVGILINISKQKE